MPEALAAIDASQLPAAVLDQFRQGAHDARGTLAPETIRALRRSFEAFSRWCDPYGQALPATAPMVTAYVDELATTGRKAAGIKQAVWAIGAVHRLAGQPDPTKAERVRQALKRMARQLGTRQKQAAPVNAYELRRITDTAGPRPIDQRDLALILLMRDLLARRSEAVALDVADISYDPDGSGSVLIRRSKTDQTSEGKELYLSPTAVAQLRRWIEVGGITEGAVFRAVDKAGRPGDRLQAPEVARIIKRLARKAGLPADRLSGHSCRVGMAQDLVAAGADVAGLMQAGRWKSMQMPARYSERLEAKRGVVAQLQHKLNQVRG
jgi:site-specific recombinase XerD